MILSKLFEKKAFLKNSFFILIFSGNFGITYAVAHNNEFVNTRIASERFVIVDKEGLLRWEDTGKEATFFGVNYCVPSACAYRMIKAVGASHEEAIESDLQHISRMGLDGIRLSFWGDSECCDEQGNLVDNEHLRLLDYLVFQAKQRGIYMLFSPIVTYSPNWPDNLNKPMGGINSRFSKSVLGTDPNAIKAQANYLSQIITHVNRYTSIAYKDEPAIIGVELVNEPIHHPEDETKALEYINTLSRAVKKTGCVKPLFFNVSQDMRMAPILAESMIDGVTFGWYPSDLLNGFSLRDNYLVNVEVYAWMRDPVLEKKAKLVYEFDAADIQGSYMYPAMARTFRTGGSQFAAMFTYDSLPIASTNIEFQTHYFNLVYTPQKAVSLIIASEAFHRLPRLKSFGSYPQNCKFEVFQVSYEQDLSEMIDESVFMYSNDTPSLPLINEKLEKIIGCGSSTVVRYDGTGIYFLEKLKSGLWRLEVYPDSVLVNDPYGIHSLEREVSRVIWRRRYMELNLTDLGDNFTVEPVNRGNNFSPDVGKASFNIRPGVYVLRRSGVLKSSLDEKKIFNRNGFADFIAPDSEKKPLMLIYNEPAEISANQDWKIDIKVVSDEVPQSVTLYLRRVGEKTFRDVPMVSGKGFDYRVVIAADILKPGLVEYCVLVEGSEDLKTFPGPVSQKPTDWNFSGDNVWRTYVVEDSSPIVLFDAKRDRQKLIFSHSWGGIPRKIDYVPGCGPLKLALRIEVDSFKWNPFDVSFKHELNRLINFRSCLEDFSTLTIRARSDNEEIVGISLIQTDSTAWGAEFLVGTEWKDIHVPVGNLKKTRAVILPRGWPEVNPYWMNQPEIKAGKGINLKMKDLNSIQISLGARFRPETAEKKHVVEIESIMLEIKPQRNCRNN